MSRPLRFIRSWQPVEITSRTLQGRFLLKPSPRLNALIAGIIAIAKSRHEIHIYNLVFLSNHFHMIVAAPSAPVLSSFMCFVMGNIAREAGRLHDWSGPFWSRRHTSLNILDEPTLLERMRYVFENGCKEVLVPPPADLSGLNAVRACTPGKTN